MKILNRLLSLQWNISQLQFKESIVLLQEVRNGLDHWKLFLQQEQPQSGSLKQIYVGKKQKRKKCVKGNEISENNFLVLKFFFF